MHRQLIGLFVAAAVAGCSSEPPRMLADLDQYDTYPAESEAPPQNGVDEEWSPIEFKGQQATELDVPEPVLQPALDYADQSLPGQYFSAASAALDEGNTELYQALLIKAADLGSSQAHYELAKQYTMGDMRVRDLDAAARHLNAAAGLGNAEAIRVLAWQLIRGDNGTVDRHQGLAMLEQSAQTSVRGQRELGMIYSNSYRLGMANEQKARQYLEAAYQAGDVKGAYELGKLLHAEGDALAAIAPLAFAAAGGSAEAAQLISQIDPAAPSQSPDASREVPRVKSVGASTPEQLYRAANKIMFRPGRQLADEAKAYAMYKLASDQGYDMATQELRVLKGVDTLMSAKDPEWLSKELARITAR